MKGMMKATDFRKVDTSKPPTSWDVAYPALHSHDDKQLTIDLNHKLTVQPGTWPIVPWPYEFLVKSIPFSGMKD
jgi:hypothetical protein